MRYVKICGISSSRDVDACLRAGADALGFLVELEYPSEDALAPAAAAQLIAQVPPFVSTVLVTHRSESARVAELCEQLRPSTLQLHGEFALEEIPVLRERCGWLKIAKAVHVEGPHSIERALAAARFADAVLLDTRTAERLGGTGRVHDWSLSAAVRERSEKPVILAGGLSPENVARAIAAVQPFAVDVNSGVSRRRGEKDPERVAAFVAAAKAAAGCAGAAGEPRAPATGSGKSC